VLIPNSCCFRRSSGVTSTWITERFENLHPDADVHEIERYARVWLWHFLGAFLFPDASGNTISWVFVNILRQPWENIAQYSWGTAVLAWTYRQLCEACRRGVKKDSKACFSGCAYLVQTWCWDRWPVGRPTNKFQPLVSHRFSFQLAVV